LTSKTPPADKKTPVSCIASRQCRQRRQQQQNVLGSSPLHDHNSNAVIPKDPPADKKMRRLRVELQLQKSGEAKPDHDTDPDSSDRRFELYNSRIFFLLRTWRALLSFPSCCELSERCCLFFFALFFLSALVFFEVA
jgi:hypothetical protein